MHKSLSTVRWRWIILGGVVAEIALVPATVGLTFLIAKLPPLEWVAFPAAMFLVSVLVGWWAAPKAGPAFVLNGLLIGAFAALIFLPLLFASPVPHPIGEAINEALKVLGGATGGAIAGWRTRRSSAYDASGSSPPRPIQGAR